MHFKLGKLLKKYYSKKTNKIKINYSHLYEYP